MHIFLHTFKDCVSCLKQLQLRGRAGSVSKCQGFYCKRSPSDLLFLPRTLTAFHLIRFNFGESRGALITTERRGQVCMSVRVCCMYGKSSIQYVHFKNSFCSYSPTFQNKGHLYLCKRILIGWRCGRFTGELEDVVWEHYAICFSLSLFYSLSSDGQSCPDASSVLIKQLWGKRLFSEHAVKLLTSQTTTMSGS